LSPDYLRLIREGFEVETDQIHVAGPGCDACNQQGIKGRIAAAEVITLDSYMRSCVREGRDAELDEYWRSMRRASFGDPDMVGKTAFEHGLYNVLQGRIDPRHLEREFEPIYTYRFQLAERSNFGKLNAPDSSFLAAPGGRP
jgi:type II secretory ATPase GspE/PulE/Tfp pilus assembly ATPase PilB-like protein